MTDRPCERLDDYLAQALLEPERAAFAAHLTDCRTCEQAIQDQERLNTLLTRAVEALEPLPPGLTERVEALVGRARRGRRARWFAGMAAASVLAVVVGGWMLRHPPDPLTAPPVVKTPLPEPAPNLQTLVQVTFPPASNLITLPQKTDNPNVTILWVYPLMEAPQRRTAGPQPVTKPKPRKENS